MSSKLPIFESPFDSYKATEVLGEGGAGRVYAATGSNGNDIAVKCLAPERINSDRLKRFKNEINFCQKQQHNNIVRIVDAGVVYLREVKCPFYVMPRYSGTLKDYAKILKKEQILQVFSQILDGIEAAHLSGVWHRDIKPENILWDNKTNLVALADFGIAHFEEEEIYTAIETKVASRMANFQYSSPEQRIRGAHVDHRADIFSLGLILNELFTGHIPQGTGYQRIGTVAQELEYLDEIIESMLRQQPEDRPNSIQEIKKELIVRKNAFVALQRFEESKKLVVYESEPPEFEEIAITSLDYDRGALTLNLNRNTPSGWAQEFQSPRGGHSSILGYGPERFNIQGNRITIGVCEDEKFIQQLVDYAKGYVAAANKGYILQTQEQAEREASRTRKKYEQQVAEANLRKNIMSKVKL
ncbi:serine/threonine-protein kinase [Dasania marina]|uniref:serine/threonine-protein kinase n=1 Tax=Dasania marina TaxID=471499 RepID=UPI0030DDB274|tara:strand:+ start:60244 stop:61485 length:1242 start_codon:yes stop_codon:yes gene_type:complete